MHGLQVLDSVSKWIGTQQMSQPLWYAGESFQNRLATLQCDLDFFLDQLTKVGKEVKELQRTLKVHLNLKHDRRNLVLTIIAVYIPLLFAATLFGMNIETKTPAHPELKAVIEDLSWIDSSPAEIQNSTNALVSTIDSSGPRTYSWQDFMVLAICLLFTLPLSLTVGSILRLAYKTKIAYANDWPKHAVFIHVVFLPLGCLCIGVYLISRYILTPACDVLLSIFSMLMGQDL